MKTAIQHKYFLGDVDGGCSCGLFVAVDVAMACVLWWSSMEY